MCSEDTGLHIVCVATNPGNINDTVCMKVFYQPGEEVEPAGVRAHAGAGCEKVLIRNCIKGRFMDVNVMEILLHARTVFEIDYRCTGFLDKLDDLLPRHQ